MNIRELLKKTTLAAILCATMATSAWAQSVAWTTAKGAQSPIDFSTEQAVGALSTATTITATGTWSAAQVTNLQAALKSDGNIETDNSTLLTVDMSAAVWSDGVTAASLFRQCTALTSVILPEADNANSISFFCTFYYCESLKSITNLEKFTNVSSFNTTFYDCSSLESITLSADTSYASINFALAFTNCTALTSVTNLEKFTNVGSFDQTFEGCSSLESITLPAGTSNASISFYYTFDGCTALTSITNLEKFTNVNNFRYAFQNCSNLTSVELGVVPTNNIVDIFKGTDPNCLKYLPAGTTTVPTNWTNCIADGKALADITLTDEKPFHCPQAFSMDGHTMTYTRTWKYATKTGGWNTLYLPFAATATADNTPLTPATGGADGDYILKTLTGSTTGTLTMTSTGTVQAYTPYLVALPGNTFGDASLEGKTVTLVSATDAVIPATPEQTEQAGAYTMYGTLADYQADNLYLLTNEADGSSFDLYTDGGGVHAFRAYITANNANALKAPRLVIGDGGGVTGIRSASVGTKEVPAISHVYSIDGRLLRTVPAEEYAHRLDGLDRGIYIVNGVKEVVR